MLRDGKLPGDEKPKGLRFNVASAVMFLISVRNTLWNNNIPGDFVLLNQQNKTPEGEMFIMRIFSDLFRIRKDKKFF